MAGVRGTYETYDHERVHFNLARLKKGGETFEIAVDPDSAIAFKNGQAIDMKAIIRSEHIFHDVSRGELANEHKLKAIFNTSDFLEVAKKIIHDGEVQVSQEYREKLVEEKKNKIITAIVRNAIDPKTKLPHPRPRIESAMEEAKIKIDHMKKAEDQIEAIVEKLKPILPITFATKKMELNIPSNFAPKAGGVVRRFGKVISEEWNNDGSLTVTIEIPAGLAPDMFDELNHMTKGSVESKTLE